MKLAQGVHTALDELRMQMLGAQVLFGFQFQGVFQEDFERVSPFARAADIAAFGLLVATLGCLLAPCAQHRLVEKGMATKRIIAVAGQFAEFALGFYALAIGFDVFAISEGYFGGGAALAAAMVAAMLAVALWYGLGLALRLGEVRRKTRM